MPLLALGGKGVISVLSNVTPQYTHDICAKWFAGETAESLSMQLKAVPLIKALFADVNPIPVKWAMNRLGWNAGDCRLPLLARLRDCQAGVRPAEIISQPTHCHAAGRLFAFARLLHERNNNT